MAGTPEEKNWQAIYEQTTFFVRNPKGELVPFSAHTAGRHSFLKQKRFAIVTAFNPMNQTVSKEENLKQNELLKKDIRSAGYEFYATSGELDGHAEDSFTVENISEAEALELGRKYRQHAILYNDEKGIRFIRC